MSRRAFLIAAGAGLGAIVLRVAQTTGTSSSVGLSSEMIVDHHKVIAMQMNATQQVASVAQQPTASAISPSPEPVTLSPTATELPTARPSATPPLTAEVVQPTGTSLAEIQSVPTSVEPPPIVTQASWGAAPPVASLFIPQQPELITLHHEGVIFDGSRPTPDYLRAVQSWSITNRGWPDIPYHFLIDLEGTIYEGRPLEVRGDTNTAYNTQGMAQVALLGKYDAGEQVPNQLQIDAIIDLMTWIAATYNIPADANHIKGHRDYIPFDPAKGFHVDERTGEKITCPGDNLYIYLSNGTIVAAVARRLANRSR
jgi:hypothetical protein